MQIALTSATRCGPLLLTLSFIAGCESFSPAPLEVSARTPASLLAPGASMPISPLGGESSVYGINELGDVVGIATAGDCDARAFIWRTDAPTTCLPHLAGDGASWAVDVNDVGVVVGAGYRYDRIAGRWTPAATLWRSGVPERIAPLPAPHDAWSLALAVNNKGDVVGYGCSSLEFPGYSCRAFLANASGTRDLGTLGGLQSQARGINELGQIVGLSQRADGSTTAVIWENGSIRELPQAAPGSSLGLAINESGQVVGQACSLDHQCRGILWAADGRMTDISPDPTRGFLTPMGLNDRGWVVGGWWPPGGDAYEEMGFLWTPAGGLQNIQPASGIRQAHDINNAGQVIGITSWENSNYSGIYQLVIPPDEQIAMLIEDMTTLAQAGTLSASQLNTLLDKLNATVAAIDRGNITAAVGTLNAFINQVNALVNAGVITRGEGQQLVDAARRAIETLSP